MKNYPTTTDKRASTYKLLMQSEEKERGLLETAVYFFLIVSVGFSIWQFAHQSLPIPGESNPEPAVMAQTVETAQPGV